MQNTKKDDFDVKKFYGQDCILNSDDLTETYKI